MSPARFTEPGPDNSGLYESDRSTVNSMIERSAAFDSGAGAALAHCRAAKAPSALPEPYRSTRARSFSIVSTRLRRSAPRVMNPGRMVRTAIA